MPLVLWSRTLVMHPRRSAPSKTQQGSTTSFEIRSTRMVYLISARGKGPLLLSSTISSHNVQPLAIKTHVAAAHESIFLSPLRLEGSTLGWGYGNCKNVVM